MQTVLRLALWKYDSRFIRNTRQHQRVSDEIQVLGALVGFPITRSMVMVLMVVMTMMVMVVMIMPESCLYGALWRRRSRLVITITSTSAQLPPHTHPHPFFPTNINSGQRVIFCFFSPILGSGLKTCRILKSCLNGAWWLFGESPVC